MKATLRLFGALRDFVAPDRRDTEFAVDVGERRSVKDLIESCGVPHCEVFVVLVDGTSVGFEHIVCGGERVAVYPHFSEFGVTGLTTAGEPLPADGRFVLDGHLGRLAAYMRALGFDVLHDRDADDDSIARLGADEDRVVLTRDVGLLKRSIVRHGYYVRATAPREQLDDVVRRFRLAERVAPFTRCLRCNTPLVEATKESIVGDVPERIHARFDEFSRCPSCGRTYWPGTHHARLSQVLAQWVTSAPRGSHISASS